MLLDWVGAGKMDADPLEEIARCGKHSGLQGLKLHLANSGVDLRKPEDVEQLVFRALHKDHAVRYATCRELARALRA